MMGLGAISFLVSLLAFEYHLYSHGEKVASKRRDSFVSKKGKNELKSNLANHQDTGLEPTQQQDIPGAVGLASC